jgi:hypothetical protein
MTMAEKLIVDFPTHRSRSKRSVHFVDMAKLHIVPRHDDNKDVHRRDLWYNKLDYSRMRLAIKKSILQVRLMISAGVPICYSGKADSFDDCLIGMEHLLTQETVIEVKTCRRRCVRAVLQEQAMNSTTTCDNIANASLVESRRAAIRARKLGKLHHDSI